MVTPENMVKNVTGSNLITKRETVILPIGDAICKPDLSYACLDSIVLACGEKGLAWDLQHHLMLCYKTESGADTDVAYVSGVMRTGHPHFLKMMKIDTTEISAICGMKFSEFAYRSLSAGYYLIADLDERYIPGCRIYRNKEHPPFLHGQLIYGYDSNTDEFLLMGFRSNRQYCKTRVTSEEIELAEQSRYQQAIICNRKKFNEFKFACHLYRTVPDMDFQFDLDVFKMMLEDYLASAELGQDMERLKIYFGCQGHYPSYQYMNYFTTRCHGGWKFGIKAHEAVAERLEYLSVHAKEIGYINNREYYVLKEHKEIMLRRFRYLNDTGLMAIPEELIDRYRQDVFKKLESVLLCVLKMEMTKKYESSVLKVLSQRVLDAYKSEENILRSIYALL